MRSIFGILCLASIAAYAQPCAHLEYAEIDAIDKAELLAVRCQYMNDWLAYLSAGDVRTNTRCSAEGERMDRVLGKKYGLSADPEKRSSAIVAMCANLKKAQTHP